MIPGGTTNAEMFRDLMEYVARRGYEYGPHREYVPTQSGHILYHRHFPIIFRPSVLKAAFGKEYETVAHAALDVHLKGGNPLAYIMDQIYQKERKEQKEKK